MRAAVAGSPSTAMPQMAAPPAPMPVHTAYTVPIGMTCSARDMQ